MILESDPIGSQPPKRKLIEQNGLRQKSSSMWKWIAIAAVLILAIAWYFISRRAA